MPYTEVLPVRAVALSLGLSPRQIRRLISQGKLVGFRPGGRKLAVPLSEVIRLQLRYRP